MENVLTIEEMRISDALAMRMVTPAELMERAGKAIADEIVLRFSQDKSILIVANSGNNGGDGFVVFRYLKNLGYNIDLFVISSPKTDEAIYNYNLVKQYAIFDFPTKKYDVIIDAIFGTGLKRNIDGKIGDIIDKINVSKAFIIACDIPSGLNGDSGIPMGKAVKANLTIAIGAFKYGYFLNDGFDYTGELIKKDIGIIPFSGGEIIDREFCFNAFLKRNKNVHKGSFGASLIIAGSKDYIGASIISSMGLASLNVGAGYNKLGVPTSIFPLVAGKVPESIIIEYDEKDGHIALDEKLKKSIVNVDSLAVGMGMGQSEDTFEIVKYILENFEGNLIIDADGLNSLQNRVEILKNKKCRVVLTPHIKEFSRLINQPISNILMDTLNLAKSFAKEYGVILYLKGVSSIITDGEKVYLNTRGNSGLAKGGSGDLLSGIIAGLLARGEDALYLASVGGYILGRSAELAIKTSNEFSLRATVIADFIPKTINEIIASELKINT